MSSSASRESELEGNSDSLLTKLDIQDIEGMCHTRIMRWPRVCLCLVERSTCWIALNSEDSGVWAEETQYSKEKYDRMPEGNLIMSALILKLTLSREGIFKEDTSRSGND